MTHLDCIATEGCKTDSSRTNLEESASRMLRSIQDTLGFSAAEDAILRWLEGCSIDGVERLSFAIDDYLQNRKEAESTGEQP